MPEPSDYLGPEAKARVEIDQQLTAAGWLQPVSQAQQLLVVVPHSTISSLTSRPCCTRTQATTVSLCTSSLDCGTCAAVVRLTPQGGTPLPLDAIVPLDDDEGHRYN